MPGAVAQGILGNFDYGQNMAMDPSIFSLDDDMAAFGSMMDDFTTDIST